MRNFHAVKLAQGLACLLICWFAISTTELHGRFYDKGIRDLLLADGINCEYFIFYKPPMTTIPGKQEEAMDNEVSNLASTDDEGDRSSSGDDSEGRIMAVFDRGNINKNEDNITSEMRFRAFLLFEWKIYNGQPETSPPDSDKAESAEIPLVAISNGTQSSPSTDNKRWPNFPNGTQNYKISWKEGIQYFNDAEALQDPFKRVASRLFIFVLLSFVQLMAVVFHAIFKEDTTKYSMCELGLSVVCFILWAGVFILAMDISINWQSVWLCAHFRPEKPGIFVLTAVLSTILAVLFLAELLFSDDILTVGKFRKREAIVKIDGLIERKQIVQATAVVPSSVQANAVVPNSINKPNQAVERTECYKITASNPL